MGTPVEPIEYAADCLTCFAAGKAPKIAHLVFRNVNKCPLSERTIPNDIEFLLTQIIGSPCAWQYIDDLYAITLTYTPTYSQIYAKFQPYYPFFGCTIEVTCVKDFGNELTEGTCAWDVWGWGGAAHFWWLNDEIPGLLCETMGFHPGPGNLFDKTPTIENMADYRIANPRDKTNCLFRVDTTIISPP